ncbi:non-ribosomal peptide synthetase, partial [Niastella populi]|uniref:non-ribosomal peptide synthetase n=1 Tax=Niastella populi TaxID=550983 RepID=UPI001054E302
MDAVSVKNLFKKLRENDIDISLNGANLQISSNQISIPEVLFEEIKLNKENIIRYLRQVTGAPEVSPILSVTNGHAGYVLSSQQRRLWVLGQFEDANIAYNMPGCMVFEGALNVAALKHALDSVIERHEILRTVFKQDEDGDIKQIVLPAGRSDFHILQNDLRNRTGQKQVVEEMVHEQFVKPFDLSTGPLLRAALFQVADDRWFFTYVMHHIISDGWSMNVLLNELLLFYNAYGQGNEMTLPPLRIQYKDYAAWQQQQLNGASLAVHKAYWMQELQGPLPVLELPTDKLRPAVKTYRGGLVTATIDETVTGRLKRLTQQQGASLFMGLLAAVNALLYRYTGEQDIIIGSPVAGRDHEELEHQLGLYLNTLALRTRFSGDDSFMHLLEQVKQVTLAAYDHQLYPFDSLIEALELKHDLSRNPLFEVMVTMLNADIDYVHKREHLNNVVLTGYQEPMENPVSKFDLSFSFVEKENAIAVTVEYNSDIFNKGTVQRLSTHFLRLLDVATRHPLGRINYLDYLSADEQQHLLTDFNRTSAYYPKEQSIIDLFESQVLLHPDKIAVQDEEGSYTYTELSRQVNRVAQSIINTFGDGDKSPVGVLLSRSAALVAVLLGVMKSGRAYLPLDAKYPVHRLNYILRQSGCRLLITEGKTALPVDTAGMSIVKLEDMLTSANGEQVVASLASATDAAYIIYTSGSTGNPKGIAIAHRSVINLVVSMQQKPGITANDVLFAVTTHAFDMSVTELFLPLVTGAKVFVAGEETLSEPQKIIERLAVIQPSILQATPGFYEMLFESGWQGSRQLKVLSGGDLLTASLARKLLDSAGEVWNMYGPTEVTVYGSGRKITDAADGKSIGYPISNTQIFIVDDRLKPVPVGIPGSIYIGGDGLALGYYRQEALTEARFISSPFDPQQKIYDTGDVGKWNEDGSIVFLGRKDNQIKIRGYRIEPAEVEAALQTYPGIETAVVMAHTTIDGSKVLVAYVVSREEIKTAELKIYIAQVLPAYMVPEYYVELGQLPVTPNGKLDRERLPAPEQAKQSSTEYIAPRNETEEKLVQLWEEVLGTKPVGVKDNFFELGGHSIRVAKLAGHIYRRFQVKAGIRDLFTNPVLEDQAQWIQQLQKIAYVAIPLAENQASYPLSSSQRRIWILSQFEEGTIAYNIPAIYELAGILDASCLQQAFTLLIARHEILRTVFSEDETGEIRQFIKTPESTLFQVNFSDLRAERDQDVHVRAFVQQELTTPFDLSSGP